LRVSLTYSLPNQTEVVIISGVLGSSILVFNLILTFKEVPIEKSSEDNFDAIIYNKKFRLLKEKMKLIEEQEDKKTYFFNRTLTDEEIEEIGTNIDGYEIWKKYVDILKEENYAKKIVELSKIREKMMYFLYELKKDVELNYSDIKGSIIYIDNGDKYFTDGIYNGGEGDMFI